MKGKERYIINIKEMRRKKKWKEKERWRVRRESEWERDGAEMVEINPGKQEKKDEEIKERNEITNDGGGGEDATRRQCEGRRKEDIKIRK